MIDIPLVVEPRLSDAVVQTLQYSLMDIGWLRHVYPIAEMNEDDEGNTYPICYTEDGEGEYVSLLPDDEVSAYSFFMDNGFNAGIDGELNTYGFTLYVWARMDYIHPDKYDFTMSLLDDVLIKLKDNECFGINVTLRNPFSEFTAMNQFINSNIKRKKTGFRIDFLIYGDSNSCESYHGRRMDE